MHAADGNQAILKGLADSLQDVAGELGELIEKQHAVMGQAEFARCRDRSATDQRGRRR